MIDVIGTDAGAPNSLPEALQDLLRQADFIAAPQRMQAALKQWLEQDASENCINSDDPIALCQSLKDLHQDQRAMVLASGDPLLVRHRQDFG